jgi:hypothetical protein
MWGISSRADADLDSLRLILVFLTCFCWRRILRLSCAEVVPATFCLSKYRKPTRADRCCRFVPQVWPKLDGSNVESMLFRQKMPFSSSFVDSRAVISGSLINSLPCRRGKAQALTRQNHLIPPEERRPARAGNGEHDGDCRGTPFGIVHTDSNLVLIGNCGDHIRLGIVIELARN